MPASALLLTVLAVLFWSILGYIGMSLQSVPAMLTTGLGLTISGLTFSLFKGREWLRLPVKTWLVGIGGIFGYHALYFAAFQRAPAIEVNLVNYLWPLLIVFLTPLVLPGQRLKPWHIIGVSMGFAGAALIASGGKWQLDWPALPGYAMAASAALIWALYSLFTKRLPAFPSSAVGGFCLVSGLLALAIFLLDGGNMQTVSMLTTKQWLLILAAAAGPLGAAFYCWDAALKRGDSRIIGSLAYMIPLLSTGILVLAGGRALTHTSGLAMLLIVGGAILGSLDLWLKNRKGN